jgi:hypothetical protein
LAVSYRTSWERYRPEGDQVRIENIAITVLSTEGHRLKKVKVTRETAGVDNREVLEVS